jgi:hypothetical protein
MGFEDVLVGMAVVAIGLVVYGLCLLRIWRQNSRYWLGCLQIVAQLKNAASEHQKSAAEYNASSEDLDRKIKLELMTMKKCYIWIDERLDEIKKHSAENAQARRLLLLAMDGDRKAVEEIMKIVDDFEESAKKDARPS